MSSNLYPNSHTRKMFGKAGQALQRQRKNFSQYMKQQLLEEEKKRIGLKTVNEKIIESERIKYDRLKNRAVILGSVSVFIIFILLLMLILL